jgi:hypothetical protein
MKLEWIIEIEKVFCFAWTGTYKGNGNTTQTVLSQRHIYQQIN